MTWADLRRLPSRVLLARQLLLEHEAEQAPMSFKEAQRLLSSFSEAVYSGAWRHGKTAVGVEAWRAAVLKKANDYGKGLDVP